MRLFRRRNRGQEDDERPVFVSDATVVAETPGPGVRSCSTCGTMWKSMWGQLADTGELQRRADEIVISPASEDQILGLTCRTCDQSWCMKHVDAKTGTDGQQRSHCPRCGEVLTHYH